MAPLDTMTQFFFGIFIEVGWSGDFDCAGRGVVRGLTNLFGDTLQNRLRERGSLHSSQRLKAPV